MYYQGEELKKDFCMGGNRIYELQKEDNSAALMSNVMIELVNKLNRSNEEAETQYRYQRDNLEKLEKAEKRIADLTLRLEGQTKLANDALKENEGYVELNKRIREVLKQSRPSILKTKLQNLPN